MLLSIFLGSLLVANLGLNGILTAYTIKTKNKLNKAHADNEQLKLDMYGMAEENMSNGNMMKLLPANKRNTLMTNALGKIGVETIIDSLPEDLLVKVMNKRMTDKHIADWLKSSGSRHVWKSISRTSFNYKNVKIGKNIYSGKDHINTSRCVKCNAIRRQTEDGIASIDPNYEQVEGYFVGSNRYTLSGPEPLCEKIVG